MKRQRTIYFNDARHYYLFVFEPPMALEDAWAPIDECAGTAVDTFIYGVARADGLFYPSKVGLRFRDDTRKFESAPYYRVWNNMQSLMDRGLDPLTVLIDRAHEKNMDFFASLRIGPQGSTDPKLDSRDGGPGFLDEDLREHNFLLLQELAVDYPSDGIELDLAAPPAGSSPLFRPEDAAGAMPMMTDWVRRVSDMTRNRPGTPGQVGARVYPTEEANTMMGFDVRTWISEGLVDYVTPMVYSHNVVDSNMPIEWLVEATEGTGTSVYPMIGPYSDRESRQYHTREWATPEMMRAAVANYWDMGVDGMYTYFLKWPINDTGRKILTELGDVDQVKGKSKHYIANQKTDVTEQIGYSLPLPIKIEPTDTGTSHDIQINVSDDFEGSVDRIREVRLKMLIVDLLADDRLTIRLNGESLENETCHRDFGSFINAYWGQWLEFTLQGVRPRKGQNTVSITLDGRAEGAVGTLVVEDVELTVKYHPFPSRLNRR
jgi:hypothetical protein